VLDEREVDEGEALVADDEVVGLDVLVGEVLLFEVPERPEEVLGVTAEGECVGLARGEEPVRKGARPCTRSITIVSRSGITLDRSTTFTMLG
jgi:hypothetical protein